jgi:hypothetical protein
MIHPTGCHGMYCTVLFIYLSYLYQVCTFSVPCLFLWSVHCLCLICTYTAKTKCRKFETHIPKKGISGSKSQFPHSCVCEGIIYFHDGSAYSPAGNMWTDPRTI